jgi:dihydrofolate reductase
MFAVKKEIKMRKIVLFMHTTIDGFAGGPNGEMDWIHVNDEIFEYAGKETDKADAALYGRVTYQMMDEYWPAAADQPDATKHDVRHSNWYKSVTKIVLSRSLKDNNSKDTIIISDNIGGKINELKQRSGKNILIFGSPTAVQLLLGENLIDEIWLFVNPVVIGKGLSFFDGVKNNLKLNLVSGKALASGVVCLHYEK